MNTALASCGSVTSGCSLMVTVSDSLRLQVVASSISLVLTSFTPWLHLSAVRVTARTPAASPSTKRPRRPVLVWGSCLAVRT